MRLVIADDAEGPQTAALAATFERDGHEVLAVGPPSDVLDLALAEPDVLVVLPGSAFASALAAGGRAQHDRERRSAFLADASPLLDASLDLRTTIDSLARLSVPSLADVCLVHFIEGGELHRVAAVAADERGEQLLEHVPATVPLPEPPDPLAEVLRSRRADRIPAKSLSLLDVEGEAPESVLVVPLSARGTIMGLLTLASSRTDHRFEDELAVAEDLGLRAALAVDNARLYAREAEIARVLQASLLPERLPRLHGVELGAAYRPAGDGTEVGGDFYDAFATDDDAIVLAIGDVTGKGATAAALTALTRHTLRTAAAYEATPSGVLHALNRTLVAQRTARGKYCTVALCRLTPTPRGLAAQIACAGHPLPLVLRADGTVHSAGRPGTVLGFTEDPRIVDVTVDLLPGDALVLYTDGISEARTADGLLGDERLSELVRRCAGLGANAIAATLQHAAFVAEHGLPRDDVAIAVARVPGVASTADRTAA